MNLQPNAKFIRINDTQPNNESHVWYSKNPGEILQVVYDPNPGDIEQHRVVDPGRHLYEGSRSDPAQPLFISSGNFTELNEIEVRITSDTHARPTWYASRIGQVYTQSTTLTSFAGDTMMFPAARGGGFGIHPGDCELVQPTTNTPSNTNVEATTMSNHPNNANRQRLDAQIHGCTIELDP